MDISECLYCGATLLEWSARSADRMPSVDDDAAWSALEADHVEGCVWVQTRAHRVAQEGDSV